MVRVDPAPKDGHPFKETAPIPISQSLVPRRQYKREVNCTFFYCEQKALVFRFIALDLISSVWGLDRGIGIDFLVTFIQHILVEDQLLCNFYATEISSILGAEPPSDPPIKKNVCYLFLFL